MVEYLELPVAIIACRVFQGWMEQYLPDELANRVTFLDYGLHQVPRNLKQAIQEQLDQLSEPHLVVLGYGLCGNGLHGIRSGRHTLLIPRADDCIAILLGSYQAYREQFDAMPGTYYLTKGWLESGSNPLREYEDYVKKYGEEKAIWLMDQQYQHYRRIAFVVHRPEELITYRSQVQEVVKFCQRWGMVYEEIVGSERFMQQLVSVATGLKPVSEDFVLVPPDSQVSQTLFLRFE